VLLMTDRIKNRYVKNTGDMFRFPGRLLSMSKTAPKGHVCVWNANIVTENKDKVWFGDLDLFDDVEDLQWYADDLGLTIYVMKEMDARFLREGEEVDLSRAVASYSPKE
jgi:hypothetical protein